MENEQNKIYKVKVLYRNLRERELKFLAENEQDAFSQLNRRYDIDKIQSIGEFYI